MILTYDNEILTARWRAHGPARCN